MTAALRATVHHTAELRLALAVCAALLGVGIGCYQTRHAYSGPKLLTTGPGLGTEVRVVRHFEAHDRQLFLFLGLIPLGGRPNGAALAARVVGENDGAVNLRFADGQDLLDMAFSNLLCVAGLVCGSWSVWAEGDVVDVVGPARATWVEPPDVDAASGPPRGSPLVPPARDAR